MCHPLAMLKKVIVLFVSDDDEQKPCAGLIYPNKGRAQVGYAEPRNKTRKEKLPCRNAVVEPAKVHDHKQNRM